VAKLGGRLARVRLPVRTSRLVLRFPQLSDIPFFLRYLNEPAVFDPVFYRHTPLKRTDEVDFVRRSLREARDGSRLNLAITIRGTRTLMGGIGLDTTDWENGRGQLGYWLAKPYWHKGYGSEAASAVCRIAFRTLKLHRVDASVFQFNPRSMKLLRRLGFVAEGRKRSVLNRGGRWHDEVLFGLLATDFRPFLPRK
jgi:RimJ/RimL family protein N-acetyltransferase